MKHMF